VVGFLHPGFQETRTSVDTVAAFRRGLSETGYDEDRNVAIKYRWAQGRNDRLQAAVIVAMNTTSVAARAATTTIPIVYTGGDPAQLGLVASLSRPGGNLTGVVTLNVELAAKRLQVLHELVASQSSSGFS